MKVKDIQVDGFGVWTGLSVDSLPEGMTLFYGPNEAGKTTLMQFLRAMLYGFTAQRRERYVPPVYGGSPGGAIRVTGPGGGYEIRRHSQLTDPDTTGRLTVEGQDGLVQGQHRLSSLLGQIDEPIFTNVFAIGIRELQELSTLDDTAAADELYKLSSGLDRVSLVDVMRSLRESRKSLIGRVGGDEAEQTSKLLGLSNKRERLRDEVEQLTRHGRRWSELATLRRTQQQEIEQLAERVTSGEREARCVEIASGVYETWVKRESLRRQIQQTATDTQLPDEAPGQLVQIEALIEERRRKVEEIKQKRREIRDKADQLPVSRRLLDLQGRIEAATEQATWVEALEEQIDRLDQQIERARKQITIDADRLGLDEDDRRRLTEGDTTALPDLSKQSLAALAGPAKQVKEQLFQLKQSRTEGLAHKEKAEKLEQQLREVLSRARAGNLQKAIREQNDLISALRHRIQIGGHLEKLKRHHRDLENESVDLATDQVLPLDRLPFLGFPFVVGGGLVLYGFCHLFNIRMFIGDTANPTQGWLCMVFGAMSLLVYYLSSERGQKATTRDLEDCERQIDTLRRQIREIESERDGVETSLPSSGQPLEQRLRDAESLLGALESALPVYHQHQASKQAYETTRQRSSAAADGLKEARRQWSATLDRLGLSESMSPSSVRNLSVGYEALQASLRRHADLLNEREQRERERKTIAKRIESLYLEALEVSHDGAVAGERDERRPTDHEAAARVGSPPDPGGHTPARLKPKSSPLEQLNHLHEELARQQHWIKRRRELKEQDHQLKKQHAAHARAIERADQQRRSLWAKCGVATADQFYQLVDTGASLVELRAQEADLDKQVRSIVGTHVQYDEVAAEIDGASASDLEKRWDALTTRLAEIEARIAQLRTSQGELAQEMKQLGDDGRLAIAQLELACVERQIESITRRWQTLATASYLLEDVCNTFERERQPETLREASSFLNQLTGGKYTRIWTPLGTSQLKIDDADENSLSLELLSRGTGEAVFIALRLALAAAYARRGVMLPLVLDDVLVNFDRERAGYAAETLRTFAELGHQVMMFTCHEHIVEIFHEIGVEVRELPAQGEPGRATVLLPPEFDEALELEDEIEASEADPVVEEPVAESPPAPAPAAEPEPVAVTEPEPKPAPVATEPPPRPARRRPIPPPAVAPRPPAPARPVEPAIAEIGWAWFEREPADGRIDDDEIAAESDRSQWVEGDSAAAAGAIPKDVVDRDGSWWNGNRISA